MTPRFTFLGVTLASASHGPVTLDGVQCYCGATRRTGEIRKWLPRPMDTYGEALNEAWEITEISATPHAAHVHGIPNAQSLMLVVLDEGARMPSYHPLFPLVSGKTLHRTTPGLIVPRGARVGLASGLPLDLDVTLYLKLES